MTLASSPAHSTTQPKPKPQYALPKLISPHLCQSLISELGFPRLCQSLISECGLNIIFGVNCHPSAVPKDPPTAWTGSRVKRSKSALLDISANKFHPVRTFPKSDQNANNDIVAKYIKVPSSRKLLGFWALGFLFEFCGCLKSCFSMGSGVGGRSRMWSPSVLCRFRFRGFSFGLFSRPLP